MPETNQPIMEIFW